jgi:hypothetical protein
VSQERLSGWVALILAVGLATALNIIVVAVLWDAVRSQGPGLSENATQILTGWGGGMIGILGGIVGYRAGVRSRPETDSEWPTQQ